PTLDRSARTAAEREAALTALAGDDLRRPFDLEHGPLLRATLVRLGTNDHALLLAMHHIVVDRWSRHILLSELDELYAAQLDGRSAVLPPLPIEYADWAVWQRELATTGPLRADLAWWRD